MVESGVKHHNPNPHVASFLLVEETGVTGDTLSHNVVSSTPHPRVIQTHNVSGDRH